MDIRRWLVGGEGEYVFSNFQSKANDLLFLYVQGLHECLNLDITSDSTEFLLKAREKVENKSDSFFLNWLEFVAIPTMNKISELDLEPYSPLIEKLAFMSRVIKTELQWSDKTKDSTISCLINSLTNLDRDLIELHHVCLESEEAATEEAKIKIQVEVSEEMLLIYKILGYNELGIMTTDYSSLFICN